MATVATQIAFDPLAVPQRWLDNAEAEATTKANAESEQFVRDATELLNSSAMVSEFEQNVAKVGAWANEIDSAFDHVTRNFIDIVNGHGSDFPELSGFLNEWRGYNQRWIANLLLSRDVASESVVVLRRFDKIFVTMVLKIQSNEDRLEVIEELGRFIEEDHPNAAKMSRAFLDLKRDINGFVVRLDAYVKRMGVELLQLAEVLTMQINTLQDQISSLDQQINDARIALAVSGGLLNVIGLITAGSLLAVYQNRRAEKADQLIARQRELVDVNRRQQALAHLKTEIDGLRPDIELICEHLVLFAEIWSSVRSQSIQIRAHIEGGMGAVGNMFFRRELELAQLACAPLKAGLLRYATELKPRSVAID